MTDNIYSALSLMKAGQGWYGHVEFPGYLIGIHGAVISLLGKEPKRLSPIAIGKYDGYQLKNALGKVVKRYRHRLVAEVVYGPCPEGHHCRHLDGDKSNCDFTNLRWGTPAENAADKVKHGTSLFGERSPASKLTDAQVIEIRRLRAAGVSVRELAKSYSVAIMTIHRAVVGTSWSHINAVN